MSLYLSANKLVSDYGTVGDYLIEWRLGSVSGEAVFISGEGTDPLLQVIHPFEDEVVQSGTLYPVIIYAYFNGQKYTLQPNYGDNYSPDLLQCLELYFVVIDGVNCASGTNPISYYSHGFVYQNTLDIAIDASRTIKFDLNSDGSTKAFAWYFHTYSVVDRIQVYYVSINDTANPILLHDWRVGNNLLQSQYISLPYDYDDYWLKLVMDLSLQTFTSGDYLLIDIIPRVLEPTNPNTDWKVYFKCLSSYSTYTPDPDFRVPDMSTLAIDTSVACRYKFSWTTLSPYIFPDDNWRYQQIGLANYGWDNQSINYVSTGTISGWINIVKDTSVRFTIHGSCSSLDGSVNIIKSGSIYTATFTNETDYLKYKNAYDAVMAHVYFSDYINDNTVMEYYKKLEFHFKVAATCGDSSTDVTLTIHYSNSVTWDDVNYIITVDVTQVTNGLPIASCDQRKSDMNAAIISPINGSISRADFDYTTYISYGSPVRGLSYYEYIPSLETTVRYSLYNKGLSAFGDYIPDEWVQFGTSAYLHLCYAKILITDANDPVNNFRISNYMNVDGSTKSTPEIIYEISDGVVITPTTTTTTTS